MSLPQILSLLIALTLLALWNLELIATLLNLRAFPEKIPAEFADTTTEEQHTKSRDYLIANARFHIIESIANLSLLLIVWFAGGFEWLDQLARSLCSSEIVTGLVFLAILMFAQSLFQIPFELYSTFVIEQKFGFNRSTIATFITDRIKSIALAGIIGLPVLAAILWIFLHISHAWLWAWLVLTGVQLLLTWVAPSWILPLFNRFSPMPDGELKQQIATLSQRCEFPLSEVFVMDGSKRSTKANAFFCGFGKLKKIALYDTLIEKNSIPELLAILAHEIGHFRRGHIKQRLAAGIFQTACIFFLLGLATDPHGPIAKPLFESFGVTTISPHVGLVLFSILMEPINKLLSLLTNAWSRRHEFEADAFAAQAIGDASPLCSALVRLSSDHLSHPSPAPLRVWLSYSHPPCSSASNTSNPLIPLELSLNQPPLTPLYHCYHYETPHHHHCPLSTDRPMHPLRR